MTFLKSQLKNNRFLIIVILAYVAVGLFAPSKFLPSLDNTWYYVKEMLMIMPVILLLTSLISAWVPKETIENAFGKNSGIKGSLFAFLLGSFSAGPIYAAFPVCKMLLSKGASIANIVIILSTWAVIKIPMLITESKFLGPEFMIVRWILTTLAIFLMGYITSRFVKPEDLPVDNETASSVDGLVLLNPDYCVGCGLCTKIAPRHFTMVDKKAAIISQTLSPGDGQAIKGAVAKCPSHIIRFHP
ncbi:permease [Acetobacterium carbinolicum]|uniref:permease n=1 Tax=Acetobacterium carbinolicum TaxID=52690 RepID=UPI0039C967E7